MARPEDPEPSVSRLPPESPGAARGRGPGVPGGSGAAHHYPGAAPGNGPEASPPVPPGAPRSAAPAEGRPPAGFSGSRPGTAVPGFPGLSRIGVFGGSFDPVHQGHLHVAAAAQAARGLQRVVFVPAAQSPHKPGQGLAEARDRVAMLRLALRGRDDWSLDEIELDRPPPSYTIDTLRQVRERWRLDPGARLYLLLGSDNLEKFGTWKDAAEILELAEPVVVPREGDLEPLRERLRRTLAPELARRLIAALVPSPPVRGASRDIRAALGSGADPADLLPRAVREYIDARGIYRAGSSLPGSGGAASEAPGDRPRP